MELGDRVDVYDRDNAQYAVPVKEYSWLRYDVVADDELLPMLGLRVSGSDTAGARLVAADMTYEYDVARHGRTYRCVAVRRRQDHAPDRERGRNLLG
jgi:hypothetical protein